MTQSKNKFEICSKACWKTLHSRGHIDAATKQGRSNKLWYGSRWDIGHTADVTHAADGTYVGNVTYAGDVTCGGNVTYMGNVTYACEVDYGDILDYWFTESQMKSDPPFSSCPEASCVFMRSWFSSYCSTQFPTQMPYFCFACRKLHTQKFSASLIYLMQH